MDVLDFFAAVGFNVNLDKDHHLIFLSGDGCCLSFVVRDAWNIFVDRYFLGRMRDVVQKLLPSLNSNFGHFSSDDRFFVDGQNRNRCLRVVRAEKVIAT